MEALGHGDIYEIDGGMYFNVDDLSIIVGEDNKIEVCAVPLNGNRGRFATFKLCDQKSSTKLTIHTTVLGSSSCFLAPIVIKVMVESCEWNGPTGDNF